MRAAPQCGNTAGVVSYCSTPFIVHGTRFGPPPGLPFTPAPQVPAKGRVYPSGCHPPPSEHWGGAKVAKHCHGGRSNCSSRGQPYSCHFSPSRQRDGCLSLTAIHCTHPFVPLTGRGHPFLPKRGLLLLYMTWKWGECRNGPPSHAVWPPSCPPCLLAC